MMVEPITHGKPTEMVELGKEVPFHKLIRATIAQAIYKSRLQDATTVQ
jgi:hypothetical protein